MASPSFEQLLEQARSLAANRSEVQQSNLTNDLLAKGLAEFANKTLFTPMGERQTYVGTVNPNTKVYAGFSPPQTSGLTLAEMLFGKRPPQVPAGNIPITQEQFGSHVLGALFKDESSKEKKLQEYYPGKSATDLESITGVKGITPQNTFNQMTALKTSQPKISLDTQSALATQFTRPEEIKTLFPELATDQYDSVRVSEVKDRRMQRRSEIIAGLKVPTAEEVKDLASGDVINDEIDRIKQLGELTGYKGIGLGKFQLGKLGQYSPLEEFSTDPDVSEMYQLISDVNNRMIYLQSGKQINEEEAKRLKAAQMDPGKNAETFKRNLDTFDKVFINQIASRQNRISQARPGGGVKQKPKSNPVKRINVKLKSTGENGTIPSNEFDPQIYEKQ